MDCKVFLDAETYSNSHRLVQEIVLDAVKKFFPLEKFGSGAGQVAGCTVLDLGCGTCENTIRFGKQVGAHHIVALDWNPNFLQYATKKADEITGSTCKLKLLQINLNSLHWHLNIPSCEFDLITSFLTLHWVKNLTNCLESLKVLMIPNRTMMFHIIGIRPGPNFQATMKTLVATEKWGPLIKAFMFSTRWQDPTICDWRTAPDPAAAFRGILEVAGFCVSVCDKMAFTYTTESEAECRGHLSWLVPFTTELPLEERDALMDDFMSVYSRFTRQDGPGRYVWENEVLVVLASRGETGPIGGGQQ